MKNYFFLIIIALLSINSFGQVNDTYKIKYQITKPYCLLNFMETLASNGYYGPTLYSYYQNSKFNGNEELAELVNKYRRLNISYTYEFGGYPKYRFMAKEKSSKDIFYTLSAKAKSLTEFKQLSAGIIPFYQHQQLLEIFDALEPMYDELVWNEYYDVAQGKLNELEKYSKQINLEESLSRFENFFDSQWPTDVPIIFTFSIVPGEVIRLVPRPQGDVVFCGLATESNDFSWYAGLLVHEFSHRAFAEKSLEDHKEIEQWFNNSKSPDRFMVNFMFNEILGGAIGHKMKEDLSGKHDFSYGQSFLRDFDEAIYPFVVSYLDAGKSLDENFVKQSIQIYGETFPNAHKEYKFLFQNFYLLTDTKDHSFSRTIRKEIASPMFYEKDYPIMDNEKIKKLFDFDFTKLIVISKDHKSTFEYLKNQISDLKQFDKLDLNSDFVLSFLDDDGKAYIIANLSSKEKFTEALEVLKVHKMIDPENPIVSLN